MRLTLEIEYYNASKAIPCFGYSDLHDVATKAAMVVPDRSKLSNEEYCCLLSDRANLLLFVFLNLAVSYWLKGIEHKLSHPSKRPTAVSRHYQYQLRRDQPFFVQAKKIRLGETVLD